MGPWICWATYESRSAWEGNEQLQDPLQVQAELITKLDAGRSDKAGICKVAVVEGAEDWVFRRVTWSTG